MTTVAGQRIGSTTYECCSTGRSMIPMEWFLLNVDVVGEEDTVNFYEDETQGGLGRARNARPATRACRPRADLPPTFSFPYQATTTLESRKWCKKLYIFIRRNTHSYGYLRKFPVRGHRHELHRPDPIPHDHQQDGHRSPRRPDPGPHQSPQRSPAQRAPEDGGPEWGDVPRPILDHDLRRGEARLFAEQRPVVRAGAPLRQIIAVVDGP